MGLKANICQVCGGALKNCGTYYKCICCDTEFRIEDSMTKAEVEAYFDRLNDFADAERNLSVSPPRFDEAESEFGLIVQKYPDWSAGYWGLVRAKFGIKFEQDLSDKAVPSCYKSSYEDFRDTDEYKKAVALAETNELRQSYEKMAEYIARVAKEWRAEAQKYDYDVFICFKDSDTDNSKNSNTDNSKTRDGREMHKLYDLLKDKGYRVFFSPVTLITDGVVGKGSEPYIFNALDKAQALIVYGSRKEYFSSTWVQNEWQRYLRAMNSGKKEKDSLIVLYEGFNPKELPQGLRRIQGIEYGISAYPAVLAALERIFRKKKESAADKEKELRCAEEEKRKAEQENAQKMQDVMAQLAAMQAELARLRSAPSAVSQPAPATHASVSSTVKQNKNSQPKKTEAKVTKQSIAKTSQPQPAPVSREEKVDPYHGQNKNDFFIAYGILKNYYGLQSEVIIPNDVTHIGKGAFENNESLKSITLPNSVTGIGENAFRGCSCLESIIMSNNITSIGENAFYGCYRLTSITIPNGVTSIRRAVFHDCGELKSITIPSSVTSIGTSSFYECSSLESIIIPNSVTNIGEWAFFGCSSLISLMISNSVTEIGNNAFRNCSELESIVVSPGNPKYHSFRNCLIETETKVLIYGCKNSEIPIDGSVKIIGVKAFSACWGLTNITIPNSVTEIGKSAFEDCSELISITISNSVTKIGDSAFYGCSRLTSVMIPNSVKYIGSWAFFGCDCLRKVTVPKETKISALTFPEFTKIERY